MLTYVSLRGLGNVWGNIYAISATSTFPGLLSFATRKVHSTLYTLMKCTIWFVPHISHFPTVDTYFFLVILLTNDICVKRRHMIINWQLERTKSFFFWWFLILSLEFICLLILEFQYICKFLAIFMTFPKCHGSYSILFVTSCSLNF